MSFPTSHKTVVVLDQSAHFLQNSCDQQFEFDVVTKLRQPTGIIPLAPITKSLWTCSVEAIAEYCRVIWDLFPYGERLIRFVASDNDSAHFINSWQVEDQNLPSVMEAFAKSSSLAHIKISSVTSSKSSDNKSTVMNGLVKAIEALCQLTQKQTEYRQSNEPLSLLNRGRIICITSFRSDAHIRSLEDCFAKALIEHNQLVSSTSMLSTTKMIPINFCELVFVNTYPVNDQGFASKITETPRHDISSFVSAEVHSCKSGSILAAKLGYLILQHYDLASTTVTGIPMKEEQNAASSANYDVELIHSSKAHVDLFKQGTAEGVCVRTSKENFPYDTVTLRWCTPRTSAIELHYCTTSYRVTSIDVNSRPSSCLTNFLLSGRAVMLEMPRIKGSKIMSHMLASHNGELYIHTLGTSRSILEDPPSISEGSGGRVTDYRINDFGELMKKNHLIKCRVLTTANKEVTFPIEKAKQFLTRQTLYWPLVIGHTILFNIQAHIQQFLNLIVKDTLTLDEVLECKKTIYYLMSMENKGTNLPIPTIGTRGKGPKREELYKIMWNELEYFLKQYCTTPEHSQVLNCLHECRSKPEHTSTSSAKSSSVDEEPKKPLANGSSKSDSEWAWKEVSGWTHDGEAIDDKMQVDEVPAKKMKMQSLASDFRSASSTGPQSLLSLWTAKLNDGAKKRPEFAGRTTDGSVAKLYINLNDGKNDS